MTGTHIKDFTQGNITKQLIAFSWPLLLSNLLQVVYNMVDMIIVGNVIGTHPAPGNALAFAKGCYFFIQRTQFRTSFFVHDYKSTTIPTFVLDWYDGSYYTMHRR